MRAQSQPPAGRHPASMLGVRSFSIAGTIVVLMLFPSAAPAGEPAPSTNQHDPHDIRIALRCRQALGQDAELSRYAVCASIRQGVAVVWGRLPTEAMVQRALQVAQRVPGVLQAKSDISIGPVDPYRDETPRLPRSIAVPFASEPVPKNDPRARGILAGNAHAPRPMPTDPAWMERPQPREKTDGDSSPPAVLLPPRASDKETGSRSAIARLIAADVRFAGIRCEENQGVVTLSGSVARMDHALDLARQISRLPGIREVVVERVRATSP